LTIHRSHTDSMVRRPRPPPLTRKTPRPLTPTRCTETPLKAPAPDSLKLPPPYLAKLRQLRTRPPAPRPGAPPLLPQDTGRQAGPGRGRQDGRWLGTSRRDRFGLWPHPHGGCRSARPLGCPRPQGDHRRHQHRRTHQVGGQNHDPEPAVPRRLRYLHHGTPPLLRPPQCIIAIDLPTQCHANRRTRSLPPTPQPAISCLARPPGLGSWRPERRMHPDRWDRTRARVALGPQRCPSRPTPRSGLNSRTRRLAPTTWAYETAQVVGCPWSPSASWRISASG
jgi:hypothetical protein